MLERITDRSNSPRAHQCGAVECRQDGALVGALVGGAQTRLAQTHGFSQCGAQATMNLLVNKLYFNAAS